MQLADNRSDLRVIFDNIRNNALRLPEADDWDRAELYISFQEGPNYGMTFKKSPELINSLRPCFPKSTGELVLIRQFRMLQFLNYMVEKILKECDQSREMQQKAAESAGAASLTASLSTLSVGPKPSQYILSELVACASDQSAWLDDKMSGNRTDPFALTSAVQAMFDSRPGPVPDEKGHSWPMNVDKFISPTFFATIHESVKEASIWRCISCLVELLQSSTDKDFRTMVIYELSNTCHMEYRRAQNALRRHVQTGAGSRFFRRTSAVLDNAGNARVSMRISPEQLTTIDPQIHYLLRLCDPDTEPLDAVDWLTQLGNLHEVSPVERERLKAREFEALSALAYITGFIKDLLSFTPLSPISQSRPSGFKSGLNKLASALDQLGEALDLRDYLRPIGNLMDPEAAEIAIQTLRSYVEADCGRSMGQAYDDLVGQCIGNLKGRYQGLKEKVDTASSPFPSTSSTTFPTSHKLQEHDKRQI